MPVLPIDHPEPVAAIWGVMLYPGSDEDSRSKARAYVAWHLTQSLRHPDQAGGPIPWDAFARIQAEGTAALGDRDQQQRDGTATGEIFKALFALFQTDPTLASWANATRLATLTAQEHGVPGSRALLYSLRRAFLPVAHLWAAWSIRDRRLHPNPDVAYEPWHDFQRFLAEAEQLRAWGQAWRPPRSKGEPPLPPEVWHMPEGWTPPPSQPGWPATGRLPCLTVPPHLLAHLRRPGRPRRSA